jgi:hypothetical protein
VLPQTLRLAAGVPAHVHSFYPERPSRWWSPPSTVGWWVLGCSSRATDNSVRVQMVQRTPHLSPSAAAATTQRMHPLCHVLPPPGVCVARGGAKDARAGHGGVGERCAPSTLPCISPIPSSRAVPTAAAAAAPQGAIAKARQTRTLGSLEKEQHFEWTIHALQVCVLCTVPLAPSRRPLNHFH